MSELNLLGRFGLTVRNINTQLNFSDQMLAISEISKDIASGFLETIFNSDDLETLSRLSYLDALQLLEQINYFLACFSSRFASQKIVEEKSKLFSRLFGTSLVLDRLNQIRKFIYNLLVGCGRNCALKDKLISHFFFRPDKVHKLFLLAHFRYPFDESLTPFDKHSSHCRSVI